MTRKVKTPGGRESDPSTAPDGPIQRSQGAAARGGEEPATLHQIGEVAERVGVSLRTVRYYEEQRLLAPETRTEGGFRLYSDEQIERLSLIKQIKPLGFTVEETRVLLEARHALQDPGAASSEREVATARLCEFAATAAARCEELSLALEHASELARRLRREALGDPAAARSSSP
jgi:DNA-binding transcriptional MerR regulator